MKIGQFFQKAACGSMILAVLACPVFTSCNDELVERVDKIEGDIADLDQRLTDLETRLNSELQALQTLLEGKIAALQGQVDELVTVSSCTAKSDGSYEITLSDGSKFTVYPEYEQDLTGVVTTTILDGVLYWAIYEDGKPVVVTDAEGNPVPVVGVTPQVDVDPATGDVYVTFDGEEWINIGNNKPCVFADAEVVYTDMYTDEQEAEDPEWYYETPMYVTITLADGNTITVTIDGTASFMFASNWGGPISTQYISPGSTVSIPVAATNITDWVKEVPAGWQVKEVTEYLKEYGQAEFVVTAPSAEAIASGAATAEGTIKVLAVAEGGKSITASVVVTTKAFKSISAGKGNLNVEMNNGVSGYLVGISPLADFNAQAIIDELKPVVEYVADPNDWSDFGWSPWYVEENSTPLDDNYFDGSIEEYPIASLKSSVELVAGEQYVIWVIGLDSWTDETTWASGYILGDVQAVNYLNAFVNVETTVLAFNDIQISAEFEGVTSFYGGFSMKYSDDDNRADLVAEINNYGAYYTPILVNDEYVEGWNDGVFTGNPIDLVSGYSEIEPGSTYYLYIIPYVEGKKYTVSDLYYYEWTTEDLIAGSDIAVTAGEPTLDFAKVAVPLSAQDAVYIYYYFVDPAMVSTIADKQAYLLENGYMSKGSEVLANKAGMKPGQTVTLIAMAVDQYGSYGQVFQQDFTAKEMTYAAATVTAEVQGTPSVTGYVKFSCDAEVDTYYYWYGMQDAYQWTSESYFGGSAESASSFIALTPSSYLLKKVTPANLPADGVEMTNLTIGSPALVVVSAKLTTGEFTKATVVNFVPAMDLGNFVYATDDNGAENPVWAAAKPTVTPVIETVGDFTTVSWTVSVPEGYTAKTACFHEDYLMDYPSAKSKVEFILSYEYIDTYDVVEGETYKNYYASKGCHIYTVICDAEGNYYETFVTELDINGGFGV